MDRTRQWGTTADQIRPDHTARYRFAALKLRPRSTVLDAACGCGYGARILHDEAHHVTGVDIEGEALDHAQKYFSGPTYLRADLATCPILGRIDALVSFETLEHMADPAAFLNRVRGDLLVASVPNERRYPFHPDVFKHDKYPHQRHYTPEQFDELLESCGYEVVERHCQKLKVPGHIEPGTDGLFLIYVARDGRK